MKQTIYDEKTGLWYELRGEYYYPYLTVPDETERPIGIWGQRHLRYLKQHKKSAYHELLRSGRLHSYLEEIDRQADAMLERLTEQMALREGVTEQLKAQDQMLWVQRMNSIQNRAEEVVNRDLVCL